MLNASLGNKENLSYQRALNEILCCPVCKGSFGPMSENEIECSVCHKRYSVKEGIFVLLPTQDFGEQTQEQRIRETLAQSHGINPQEIIKTVSLHHCIPVMSARAREFRRKFSPSRWVLDVGCGTAYYWRNSEGGSLILLDFAFSNLKAAKSLLGGCCDIIFIQSDAACLPIRSSAISGIWSVQVTQHFPDSVMRLFLEETKRILKGKFLLEVYNLNPALLDKVLYRALGKKLCIKGKISPSIILNRLDDSELIAFWKGLGGSGETKIEYSEIFFHPDLHFNPQGKYTLLMDNLFKRMPYLSRFFSRQIQIKISSDSEIQQRRGV